MTSIHRPKHRENAAESAADSKGDGQNACANNSPNSRFGCWTIPLTKDGTADLQANAHTSSGRSTSRRSKPRENGKESAYTSLWLATIDRDAPTELGIEDIKYNGWNRRELYRLLTEFEFVSSLKKLGISSEEFADTSGSGEEKRTDEATVSAEITASSVSVPEINVTEMVELPIVVDVALGENGDAHLVVLDQLDALEDGLQRLPVIFPVHQLAHKLGHDLAHQEHGAVLPLGDEGQLTFIKAM